MSRHRNPRLHQQLPSPRPPAVPFKRSGRARPTVPNDALSHEYRRDRRRKAAGERVKVARREARDRRAKTRTEASVDWNHREAVWVMARCASAGRVHVVEQSSPSPRRSGRKPQWREANGCTLIARLGEADGAMERYVMICAQLRWSRSIGPGDRYVSQHPFTSEMSEVRIKSLGDGPSTTGSTTVWVPRLGDLAELHARELRRTDRGRPAAWYRAAVLRAIADACERYPDATAEEAAARLFAERRRK